MSITVSEKDGNFTVTNDKRGVYDIKFYDGFDFKYFNRVNEKQLDSLFELLANVREQRLKIEECVK